MSSFLDQYESLDVIGNGSFGIIRKVRRKADGMIFARKELNFERMSERDRKQIVSEVNILKELNNEHIVRYHDRYVDRDAGILYILMEYCGGGDLSIVIKQASKANRPIPEDSIWNYFMQILLALHHCHHPNGGGWPGRPGIGIVEDVENGHGSGALAPVKERRAQILHRDLKPDNVFLDENNHVKLGDFGLSKALSQSSFANTYVGTPYYMSPELMQEKAYDTKSDIWSLGCLVYELCALKPPFHEAKTHSELSMCIRNGRIPPLPRGYSQPLSAVIKAMLNLNPAMRPSAAQLLQHERLELSFRVSETDKLLSQVKSHRTAVLAKEREVVTRETKLSSILSEKDTEIARLRAQIAQTQRHPQITRQDVELAVEQAVARREEELRILIQRREQEVASAMAKREEEIMEAVRLREAQVCQAWCKREAEIRREVGDSISAVQERVEWNTKREEELRVQEEQIEEMREEAEERIRAFEALQRGKIQKAPLEEVKNACLETPTQRRPQPTKTAKYLTAIQTPITRPNYTDTLPSAMKGVILTATGETLATPSPNELAKLFNQSPRVGLGFTKIFESDPDLANDGSANRLRDERRSSNVSTESEADSPPPSPSVRKEKEKKNREKEKDLIDLSDAGSVSSGSGSSTSTVHPPSTSSGPSTTASQGRLRRPSIRSLTQRPTIKRALSTTAISAAASSKPAPSRSTLASSSTSRVTSKSLSRQRSSSPLKRQPQQQSTASTRTTPVSLATVTQSQLPPVPVYDFTDEENLPSPFLKKVDRESKIYGKGSSVSASTSSVVSSLSSRGQARVISSKKRPSTSGGNYLRAMAAANAVNEKRAASVLGVLPHSTGARLVRGEDENVNGEATRPALLSARKAMQEAQKVLLR